MPNTHTDRPVRSAVPWTRPVAVLGLLLLAAACGQRSSPPADPGATGSPDAASSSSTLAPAPEAGATVPTDREASITPPQDQAAPPSIGEARMLEDGTLVLDLRAQAGGIVGDAQIRYAPTDPRYEEVLQHLGGMRPGERKPVPPWPDDIDDARVHESVRNYIMAEKGWAPEDYTIEITGTDASDRIAVSVTHREDRQAPQPGGGRSIALRLHPQTYLVVEELAFQ